MCSFVVSDILAYILCFFFVSSPTIPSLKSPQTVATHRSYPTNNIHSTQSHPAQTPTRARINVQGGDKLTLNLTGPMTPVLSASIASATAHSTPSPTTPLAPSTANRFSPPLLIDASTAPTSLLNGVSVTHYSEQKGEMISIPAPPLPLTPTTPTTLFSSPKVDNTIRAEANLITLADPSPSDQLRVQTHTADTHIDLLTSPASPNQHHHQTNNNPFLNMSPQLPPHTPTGVSSSAISSTNPFQSTPPQLVSNPFRVPDEAHRLHEQKKQLLLQDVVADLMNGNASSTVAKSDGTDATDHNGYGAHQPSTGSSIKVCVLLST